MEAIQKAVLNMWVSSGYRGWIWVSNGCRGAVVGMGRGVEYFFPHACSASEISTVYDPDPAWHCNLQCTGQL